MACNLRKGANSAPVSHSGIIDSLQAWKKHRAHRRRRALATSFVITIGTAATSSATELVTVGCTNDPHVGTRGIEAFVYKDGLRTCRKVAAGPCTIGPRGECLPPEGDPVPCP
jgi:hypothetical protein